MTSRYSAIIATALVGFVADSTAFAQPVAPAPRPTFSNYGGLFAPGAGYYGYGRGYGPGFGGPGSGFGFGFNGQQQNLVLQQQLAQTNQNIANLQTFLATGVNPNVSITGHVSVFNSLGHWYPMASNGGAGGGGSGGFGRGMSRPGGSGMSRPGAGTPTTAGSGVPLGAAGPGGFGGFGFPQ